MRAEDFRETATEYCTARRHSAVFGPQAVLHNSHGYADNAQHVCPRRAGDAFLRGALKGAQHGYRVCAVRLGGDADLARFVVEGTGGVLDASRLEHGVVRSGNGVSNLLLGKAQVRAKLHGHAGEIGAECVLISPAPRSASRLQRPPMPRCLL